MSVGMMSLDGKAAGSLELPKEIFGAEVNTELLSQAVRVYLTNSQNHRGHTKTRGEINMTTAKWFRQKGTGRARHGAKSAPIFVGGGVALGPRYRNTVLELPEKMKKTALISALSQKMKDGQISAVKGLENSTGKTKEMAGFVRKIEKKTILMITDGEAKTALRATKNIKGLSLMDSRNLNALEVIKHQGLVLTKEAVEKLQSRLVKVAKND